MNEEPKVLLVENEETPEKKYGFLGGAPSFTPQPERNWARYQRCPVCREIMSGNRKKLKEIQKDVFIHLSCVPVVVRQAITKVARDKAAREAAGQGVADV